MNRNFKKALLTFGLLTGLIASAVADDWVYDCYDFVHDKTSPYSTTWGEEVEFNQLFGCAMGVSGTARFDLCFGTPSFTGNMAGRIGFTIGASSTLSEYGFGALEPFHLFGPGGSTQDNLAGTPVDDGMGLTCGMPTGISGNFGIANILLGDTAGNNVTKTLFGGNGLDTYYFGASDRYFVGAATVNKVRVIMRCDVIGDAARLQWQLQNTQTTAATVGLWFGQYVFFNGLNSETTPDFVTVPGLKPMTTDHRFVLNPNPNRSPTEYSLPPYLNYGIDQSLAYGLQVVLQPSQQIPDQTAADGIDVGKAFPGWLLTSSNGNDGGMPDQLLDDTTFSGGDAAYIEKWNPLLVTPYTGNAPGGSDTRTIVAYYRSTWSVSDYQRPYSAVLDAPPVVATTPGAPQSFSNSPFFLSVLIDNTRGFSTIDKAVPLQDVKVTVDLPQGMTDANDPQKQEMVVFIPDIEPQTIGTATFKIAVDPKLFGSQQYTVTIAPNPGITKVLTGTIVVASQPYIQVTSNANLVSAPWQFSQSDWNTIIGQNSGLVLDQDYQVFGWDAVAQAYVLQTGPQRGSGSFVISNVNANFVALGGNPQQVQDLQAGAPQIIVQPGWNLIANPYNYAIPIGQIVGVPESDNQNAYTFEQLADQNIINSDLASWDPGIQGYKYTTSFTDLMQPNTGYWLFVQSAQPVVIDFPPVFQPFLPGLADTINSIKAKEGVMSRATPLWALQLVAANKVLVDDQSFVGQATTGALVKTLTRFKPPIAPLKNAISSSFLLQSGKKTSLLSRALTTTTQGTQTWNWQVYTASDGAVNLAWPNMSSVPNNVQIKLVDTANGTQKDLRRSTSYSFLGKAKSLHNFVVVVQTGPAVPVISSVSATPSSTVLNASYVLSVNATSTVTVMQNGQAIATLVNNRADSSGTSTATWNFLDSANRKVRPGTYQLIVSSTPSGGTTETKGASFVVAR